ncbi:hypothetical protein PC113_g18092 [Phytophthora cactorum]|uniref:Integrase-like, catalytic domain n=1 Tax=Phytophthora cactorum TaxID=29920 RepID=A0A8T0Y9U0_9STRA|nr:hypothetical protein PC113_g18092 [Phytophthora cactorum]
MTSRYKPELVKFMSYKDGIVYDKDRVFTTEELLQIIPDHLCRWMSQQAYGDAEPSEEMRPVHRRSTTLEFSKKAISSFMPRINATWDPVTERGNPTRSDAVNKLIKKVKKFEVRREGAETKARRSVKFEEFMNLLLLVRSQWEQNKTSFMVGSVLSLQWHIMARIDDMMKLQLGNFSPNTEYASTLLFQMRWSKNIQEERDAPEQIVVGSMDPKMCALLNLAVYIQSSTNVTSSEFLYGNPKDGDRAVRRFLAGMVKDTAFKKIKSGKLGTHSLRKGAATYATRSGISKGFVNRCGRWRTRKGVVDVYIDNTQPYPDSLTAASLTGPAGPCLYTTKTGISCVTPQWLVDQVVPTVKQLMGDSIATTLALPLLWAALEPPDNYQYPLLFSKLKQKILCAYTNAGGSPDLNPVVRREFFVTGDGSQLSLVVIDSSESAVEGSNTSTANTESVCARNSGARREFAALHSQIAAGRRLMAEVMNEVQRARRDSQRDMQKTQAILRRLAMKPGLNREAITSDDHPENSPNASAPQRGRVARLSKRPKDLFELWHEYQFGCGGLKPA